MDFDFWHVDHAQSQGRKFKTTDYGLKTPDYSPGGLAQLARAPALHAGGQRFESVILHKIQLAD